MTIAYRAANNIRHGVVIVPEGNHNPEFCAKPKGRSEVAERWGAQGFPGWGNRGGGRSRHEGECGASLRSHHQAWLCR